MDVFSIGQAGIYSLSMRDTISNFVTYLTFSLRQSQETLVNTMLKETPSRLKYNKKIPNKVLVQPNQVSKILKSKLCKFSMQYCPVNFIFIIILILRGQICFCSSLYISKTILLVLLCFKSKVFI